MTKEELRNHLEIIINSPACYEGLRVKAKESLSTLGTEKEKESLQILLEELKADVLTVDDVIPFLSSKNAKKRFGEEKAKELLTLAQKRKAEGGKYCICDACTAGGENLDHRHEL